MTSKGDKYSKCVKKMTDISNSSTSAPTEESFIQNRPSLCVGLSKLNIPLSEHNVKIVLLGGTQHG